MSYLEHLHQQHIDRRNRFFPPPPPQPRITKPQPSEPEPEPEPEPVTLRDMPVQPILAPQGKSSELVAAGQSAPQLEVPRETPRQQPTLRLIFGVCCATYGQKKEEVRADIRTAGLVHARQLFCYSARTIGKRSYPEIGRFMGRDHTTVLWACQKISGRIQRDIFFADEVAALERRINEAWARETGAAHTEADQPAEQPQQH